MVTVGASIDCCDYLTIKDTLRDLEEGGIDYIHVDVMDGTFVPNFGVGTSLLKAIAYGTRLPIELHLMVCDVSPALELLCSSAICRALIHVEALRGDALSVIQRIRSCGKQVGLSINPATHIHALHEWIADIDRVQLMSVTPGFAGQKFNWSVLRKIEMVREILTEKSMHVDIAIDGGIGYKEIGAVVKAGANSVIAGTTVLFTDRENVAETSRQLVAFCRSLESVR